jgi:putative ABC transport system substrate-binding protein
MERTMRDVQELSHVKGLQVHTLKAAPKARSTPLLPTSSNCMQARCSSTAMGFFFTRREQIVALTARNAIPTIYEWRDYVAAGGLISYGVNAPAAWRQVGVYAGKILSGAKLTDLPVQQPTKFEMVVNLKTAKELGLVIPESVLIRADEVIE